MTRRIFRVDFTSKDNAGATVMHRFASEGHVASISGTPTFIDGRIKSAGVLSRNFFGSLRLRGETDVGTCAIVLQNLDGALDSLRTYAFDGQPVEIYEVDPVTYVAGVSPNFRPFITLIAEQPLFDASTVTFAVRGMRHKLLATLTTTKYAGTNAGSPLAGIEGTANDIKGKSKPALIGQCLNVSPILVNTDKRIYQVHGWVRPAPYASNAALTTGWSMTVYDKRSALTAGANYTSQADMETNVPAAGQYRVWPAGGCFRLGSAPTGIVTADVTNPGAVTAQNTVLAVLQDLTNLSLVGTSLQGLFSASNPTVGIYISEDTTYLDAFAQILAGVGCSVDFGQVPDSAADLFTSLPIAQQLTAPASLSYTAALSPVDLDQNTIKEMQLVALQDQERGLPVWRVTLNYARNWTVMGESDLAGVGAADKEFCKRQYRSVIAEDATVKTQWARAQEIVIDSLLTVTSEAQAEADRLLALLKVPRDTFTLTLHYDAIRLHSQFTAAGTTKHPRMFQLGSIVRITYPRYNLGAGKLFVVLGMQENFDTESLQLTVWG